MHLLDLHWNRQHHAFLITYRPLFMRDWACNGPVGVAAEFGRQPLPLIYHPRSTTANCC
jgi:hypothetical protein